MRTIDFIFSYLKTEATDDEKALIRKALMPINHPPVNSEYFVIRLIRRGKEMYTGQNKLDLVKFVKDETAWGLKECKDFCDLNIFV